MPRLQSAALGLAAATALALSAGPSFAEPRLPPLDTDPLRCQRAYVGNTIGAPRPGSARGATNTPYTPSGSEPCLSRQSPARIPPALAS